MASVSKGEEARGAVDPLRRGVARAMRFGTVVCRIVMGMVLIVSGFLKIQNPWVFLLSICKYDATSFTVSLWLATVVPVVTLVFGVLLLSNVWVRLTAAMTCVMLLAFTLAQLVALARGLEIGCGCFGSPHERIGVWSVARNAILMVVCAIVYYRSDSVTAESRVVS